MSYQIIYQPENLHITKKNKKQHNFWPMVCVIIVLIFGFLHFSGWGDVLRQYMTPGDPDVTAAAFQNMTDSLQQGQTVSDAISVFCETVLQGAKLG